MSIIHNPNLVEHFIDLNSKSEILVLGQASHPIEQKLEDSEVNNAFNTTSSEIIKKNLSRKHSLKPEISEFEAPSGEVMIKIDLIKKPSSINQIAQNYMETNLNSKSDIISSSPIGATSKNPSLTQIDSQLLIVIDQKIPSIQETMSSTQNKSSNQQSSQLDEYYKKQYSIAGSPNHLKNFTSQNFMERSDKKETSNREVNKKSYENNIDIERLPDKLKQNLNYLAALGNDRNKIENINKNDTPKAKISTANRDETPSLQLDNQELDVISKHKTDHPDTILENEEDINSIPRNVNLYSILQNDFKKVNPKYDGNKIISSSNKKIGKDDQLLDKELNIEDFQKLRNSLGSRNSLKNSSQNRLAITGPQDPKSNETIIENLIDPYEFHNLRKNAETPININEEKIRERKSKISLKIGAKSPRDTIKDASPHSNDFASNLNNPSKEAIVPILQDRSTTSIDNKNKDQSKFNSKEDSKRKSPNVTDELSKDSDKSNLQLENNMIEGEQYFNSKEKLKVGDHAINSKFQVHINKMKEFTLGAISESQSISFENKNSQANPQINNFIKTVYPTKQEIKSSEKITLDSERKVKSLDKIDINKGFVSLIPRKYGPQSLIIPNTKEKSVSVYRPSTTKIQYSNGEETSQNQREKNPSPKRSPIPNRESEIELKVDIMKPSLSKKMEDISNPFPLLSQSESTLDNQSIYGRSQSRSPIKFDDKNNDFEMISVYSKKSLDSVNSSIAKEIINKDDTSEYKTSIPKINNLQPIQDLSQNHEIYQKQQNTALNETRMSKMDENEAAQLYEKRRSDILNDIKRINKKKFSSSDKKLPVAIDIKKLALTKRNDPILKNEAIVRTSLNKIDISKSQYQFNPSQKAKESQIAMNILKTSFTTQKEILQKNLFISKKTLNQKDTDNKKNTGFIDQGIPSLKQDKSNFSLKKADKKYWIGKSISDSAGFSPRAVGEISSINYLGEFIKDAPLDKSEYIIESQKFYGKNDKELGTELYNTGVITETIKSKKEKILKQIENIDKQLADENSPNDQINLITTFDEKNDVKQSNQFSKSKAKSSKLMHQSLYSSPENILAEPVSLSSEKMIRPHTPISFNSKEFQKILFGNKHPNSYNMDEYCKNNSRAMSKSMNGTFKKIESNFQTPIIKKDKFVQSTNDLFSKITNGNNQSLFKKRTSIANIPNNGSYSVRTISQNQASCPYQDEIINSGYENIIMKSNLRTSSRKEINDNKHSHTNNEENLPATIHLEVNKSIKKFEFTA